MHITGTDNELGCDLQQEACPDIFGNPNSFLPFGIGASWFSAK